MHTLINLISRILAGEKLEGTSRQDTARWLSAFALTPIWILNFGYLLITLEPYLSAMMEKAWFWMLIAIPFGLSFISAVLFLSKKLVNHLTISLCLSIAAWLLVVHLLPS